MVPFLLSRLARNTTSVGYTFLRIIFLQESWPQWYDHVQEHTDAIYSAGLQVEVLGMGRRFWIIVEAIAKGVWPTGMIEIWTTKFGRFQLFCLPHYSWWPLSESQQGNLLGLSTSGENFLAWVILSHRYIIRGHWSTHVNEHGEPFLQQTIYLQETSPCASLTTQNSL